MNGTSGNWVNAIRGPVTLITVGALFVLNNFTGVGFEKTWPVLLIVFGLLSLLRRSVTPPPPPPVFPPPTYTYNPPPAQASGSYSGSSYSQQPPPRGGFGTTSPAKPDTAEPTPPSGGVA
jgi:Domain of unknown function (DUF5668)